MNLLHGVCKLFANSFFLYPQAKANYLPTPNLCSEAGVLYLCHRKDNPKPQKMKKILFLFVLLLAVSVQAQEPAKAQQVKYTVKGVSKENGKMVYLEDKLTSKLEVRQTRMPSLPSRSTRKTGRVGTPCSSMTAKPSAST